MKYLCIYDRLKKVQKDVSLHEPIGMDKDGHSLEITDLLQGIG